MPLIQAVRDLLSHRQTRFTAKTGATRNFSMRTTAVISTAVQSVQATPRASVAAKHSALLI